MTNTHDKNEQSKFSAKYSHQRLPLSDWLASPTVHTLFWTAVAIIIFVLVYQYDRKGVKTVLQLQKSGIELESNGSFVDAIQTYKEAFFNHRATNRKKGELALHIADIYYYELNLPSEAEKWYIRAKMNYPKILVNNAKGAHNKANGQDKDSLLPQTTVSPFSIEDRRLINTGDPIVQIDGDVYRDDAIRLLCGKNELTSDVIDSFLDDELIYKSAIKNRILEEPELLRNIYRIQRNMVIDYYLNVLETKPVTNDSDTSTSKQAIAAKIKQQTNPQIKTLTK